MTPEFKAKWLAALRSGDYKQGRRVLKDPEGGYCCLGVACDLIDPRGWNPTPETVIVGYEPEYGSSGLVEGYAWRGTKPVTISDLPDLLDLPRDTVFELTHLNDSGKSFGEIADFIETLRAD